MVLSQQIKLFTQRTYGASKDYEKYIQQMSNSPEKLSLNSEVWKCIRVNWICCSFI